MTEPVPPRPRTVLLDAGNTIVFLDCDAVVEILAGEGERVSADAIRNGQSSAKRAYGQLLRSGEGGHHAGWGVFVASLLEAAGLPRPRAQQLVPRIRSAHEAFNLWRRVPDGIPDALSRLRHSGTQLGVVSNSEGRLVELLEGIGMHGYFDVIVDSGVEGISKPDPAIFERALSRLHADPKDALYCGDAPEVDVEGARTAGLGAVLVDAFDDYPGYLDAPRVRSVCELVDVWLPSSSKAQPP